MNIVIAGLGRYAIGIESCLRKDVTVLYYMDNSINKRGKELNGKKIISHYQCDMENVDYVVIGIMEYEIMIKELQEKGIPSQKIIPFFSDNVDWKLYDLIFDLNTAENYNLKCNIVFLKKKVSEYEQELRQFKEHFVYEIVDRMEKVKLELPNICSVEETCNKIIREKVSISRYGDGEFEIIFGKAKDIYQQNNFDLAIRLKEILTSNLPNHIVALADDYGDISCYREENQKNIRRYMTDEKRKKHYKYLNFEKKYYNAYISRPYVIYPHEKRIEAERRFKHLKQIWQDKDILIIEGELTRMGIGNDLFENAKSLKRIIAPNMNAYDKYDEILECAKQYGENKVMLIALGPTATVLAYDLAKLGYWALDIGHLDLEYEWFLKGEGYSYIPNKYNNEVLGDDEVCQIDDKEYEKSILKILL